MDERTLGLIAGNAAGVTTSLIERCDRTGLPLDSVIADYAQTLDRVTDLLVNSQAAAMVKAGFPGTFEVPSPTPPVPAVSNGIPPFATAQSIQPQPAIVAPPQVTVGVPVVPNGVPTVPNTTLGTVIPFPQAQAPAQVAPPVAIPGASTGGDREVDEAALQLISDIQNGRLGDWEDNRAVKAADSSKKFPDFKHKTWKRPGSKYFVGVYTNDKKMSPEVAAQLRAVGL